MSKNEVNYICQHCEKEAVLNNTYKIKRLVLKNLVYKYYFNCSECKKEHVAYYTDKKIRKDIKNLEKKREKWSDSFSVDESRKRLAEISMIDKLIEVKMESLKNKMEKENEQIK